VDNTNKNKIKTKYMLNAKKLAELNQYIEAADLSLQQAREILKQIGNNTTDLSLAKNRAKNLTVTNDSETNQQIIEGIFNGQNMIGHDNKEYSVPANYASKSKLVTGDILKLTIEKNGSFIYKQIKPTERERLTGELVLDEVTNNYAVLTPDHRKLNVLTASVTYFKGKPGDQATILIPKDQISNWAAIENVMPKGDEALEQKVKEILPSVAMEPEPIPALDNIESEKKEVENIINNNQNLDIDNLDLGNGDLEDL